MYVIPAIDLKDGMCVRLKKGAFDSVGKVAEDTVQTALGFEAAGAEWLHMVDLDGALHGKGKNYDIISRVIKATRLKVEIGGGIRDMETLDMLHDMGASRMIIGSAAVENPDFVKRAVLKYGEKIAVGIDTLAGEVKTSGWTKGSGISGLEFAKNMEILGVKTFIFTDIERDGMLSGPPVEMYRQLRDSLSADIIASGGVSSIADLAEIERLGLYGAIVGKAVYTGDIDLGLAVARFDESMLARFFEKSELTPVIIQHCETGEVLMLGYTNLAALRLTIETGRAWFFSRSRGKLWNKGETSGNFLDVKEMKADCDNDTLLYKCMPHGPVCHTGSKSCFFNDIAK